MEMFQLVALKLSMTKEFQAPVVLKQGPTKGRWIQVVLKQG